jgi:thioester reductase-like protein
MVTPDYLHKIVQSGIAQTYMLIPSILEDLFKVRTAASWLSKVSHIAYGGGPLSKPAGDYWASKLPHLFSFFGMTETCWFHLESSSSSAQWDMIKPAVGIGLRFDEITENVFELVVENTGLRDQFTATFEVFPDLKEYRTKDLYAPSHKYDGWWRYLGRTDDLIVLSNGEKIDPVPMEAIIMSHTYVKGALMAGEFRFMPSLLVELDVTRMPAGMTDGQIVEAIWPKIEEANKIAPRFAKISRTLILATEVSFRRSGKGTIQRKLTTKDRAEDLNQLYKSAAEGLLLDGLKLEDPSDSESLKDALKQIYEKALGASIEDDQDVFVLGMDSLQVIVILQRIKAILKNSRAPLDSRKLTPQLVYSSPTINKISTTIGALINQNENGTKLNGNPSRETKIAQLIERYSANFSNLPQAKSIGRTTQPLTIILTGTTGSLGSYLLSAFLSLPPTQVAKIYCFNRSPNSEKKQKRANTLRGLSTDWSSRAEFLHVDLPKPDFGLEPEKYTELLENTDVIVHNAWKVDFNVPLESFEAQIHGVENLLYLSAKSTKSAPLGFCSSIATVLRWMNHHPTKRVPAEVLDDLDAPEAMGYAESKYVSERIIDNFTKATGIGSVVLRVGQIAGPTTDKGCWNRQEWFPSLVASSKYLAMLPDSLGFMNEVDWIPVDLLANIIVELLVTKIKAPKSNEEKGNEGAIVYNLVNPRVTSWGTLLLVVKDAFGKGKGAEEIKVVSSNDWCEALRKSASENGVAMDKNPGVKLVDYFESNVGGGKMVEGALKENGKEDEFELKGAFDVVNLLDDSYQAESLHAVGVEWIRLWLRQWDF